MMAASNASCRFERLSTANLIRNDGEWKDERPREMIEGNEELSDQKSIKVLRTSNPNGNLVVDFILYTIPELRQTSREVFLSLRIENVLVLT